MPISATGDNRAARRRSAGFTLVELMVVMVIIGVMAAAAVVAIPDPRGRVADDAEAFAARLVTARDLAIVGGRDIGVRIDAAGYGFDQRGGDGWTEVAGKALQPVRWAQGVAAASEIEGGAVLLFDTTGLATPGLVRLEREGERATVAIDSAGAVRVDAR